VLISEGNVKETLLISDVKICKIIRLGKCRENSRPLLVSIDDERSIWACLKHAPRLKNDPIFHKAFLPPDLSLKERVVNKKLYVELKSHREKDEKNHYN